MLENHDCASQDEDEYGKSDKGGNELKDFRVLKGASGALLLRVHEQCEFFIEGDDQRFDVVFEFERQPL